MKHGEVRDHHYENEKGQRVHVLDGGACQSVCEKWCATCQKWIRCEGVVGGLKFMADHGHKEERAQS